MDKDSLKVLRNDINAALAAVAKKHNLSTLKATSCKYMESSCEFKLEAVQAGGLTKEAARYVANQVVFGLPPLHTKVTMNHKVYRTVGLNTTGTKVITEDEQGKQWLVPLDSVINAVAAGKVVKEGP